MSCRSLCLLLAAENTGEETHKDFLTWKLYQEDTGHKTKRKTIVAL